MNSVRIGWQAKLAIADSRAAPSSGHCTTIAITSSGDQFGGCLGGPQIAAAINDRHLTVAGQGAPHRTGGFTDTTDTAANIIAALPLPAVIGECFTVEIVNTTSYAQTLSGETDVTLAGLAGPNPANSTLRGWLQYTSAGAVAITVVEMSYNAVVGWLRAIHGADAVRQWHANLLRRREHQPPDFLEVNALN